MNVPNESSELPTGHGALDQLTPEQYEELRRLAAFYLRGERADHTLQATALVHEALLRILKRGDVHWQHPGSVVAFAAQAMRRILVSYGVARGRQKRGGTDAVKQPLEQAVAFYEEKPFTIAAVDEALQNLERMDQRQAQIVEMRFFAGLTIEEIGDALAISPATVKREWATAKLWLHAWLSEHDEISDAAS